MSLILPCSNSCFFHRVNLQKVLEMSSGMEKCKIQALTRDNLFPRPVSVAKSCVRPCYNILSLSIIWILSSSVAKKITCSCLRGAIPTSLRQIRGSPAALLQQKIHAKHILLLNCVNPLHSGQSSWGRYGRMTNLELAHYVSKLCRIYRATLVIFETEKKVLEGTCYLQYNFIFICIYNYTVNKLQRSK